MLELLQGFLRQPVPQMEMLTFVAEVSWQK
jgi:hypothetical protein